MTAQELWNAYQAQAANTTEGDSIVTDTAIADATSNDTIDNTDSARADSAIANALPYTAWAFGGLTAEDTNTLANLVRSGAKTATAGAYDAYLAEGSALPKVGEYNIVLDTNDIAVCITRTTAVTTLPFCEVPAAHAQKEGEGDGSLTYWRAVHQAFFSNELAALDKKFNIRMPVVCEEFEMVFAAPEDAAHAVKDAEIASDTSDTTECEVKTDGENATEIPATSAGIAKHTPVLETERLTLRPITTADAEAIFNNWTSDPEVAKFMRWNLHPHVTATTEWLKLEEAAIDGGNYNWGFVLKSSGALIGAGGLVWKDSHQMYELGYNLMKAEWGKGLATEASRAMLRFAKEELGQSKMYCCHAVENIASQKVIEKLGFAYAGVDSYQSFDGTRQFESKYYFLEL